MARPARKPLALFVNGRGSILPMQSGSLHNGGRFSLGFNWRYDSGLVAGETPCYGVTDPNSPCLLSASCACLRRNV
jgi:hypothetical protein